MAADPASLFHILNPSAACRAEVRAFFDQEPWDHVWIERKSHPTHLETAVNWAVNESRSAIAVWGGDGSFSRVINALNELNALESISVLLVPVGTCNDFARHLGFFDWRRTVSSPLVERRTDLIEMSHSEGRRLFVNNAGFGRRPEARRDRRPSAVGDIFRMRSEPIVVSSEGASPSTSEMSAMMGIVFNAPYFGGGRHFSTDMRSDDGILEAYLVGAQSPWRLLWSFLRGSSGRPFLNNKTVHVRGTSLRLETRGSLYPQADGETASNGAVRKIEFSVRPRALRLLVPQPRAGKE